MRPLRDFAQRPSVQIVNLIVSIALIVGLYRVTSREQAEVVGEALQPVAAEVEQTTERLARTEERADKLFSVLWCILIEGPKGEHSFYNRYSIDLLVACAAEVDAEVQLLLPPPPPGG